MPQVPGDIPVYANSGRWRLAMAVSTELIELCGRHLLWIPNQSSRTLYIAGKGRPAMKSSRAVASLATYSQLQRLQLASRTDGDGSGRVAFEAFQYPSLRIQGLVKHTHRLRPRARGNRVLSRSCGERSDRLVVGQIMLQVPILVYSCYKRNGLLACSERPFHRDVHDIFVVDSADPEGVPIDP